jgi:adenylate kinase
MKLVLIGPPGSGKGSVGLFLKNNYGFTHISTGDLLRAEVATGSDLGKEIAALIDNGKMVNDEISLKVMKQAIIQSNGNCIFDGYPRNLKQLELLESVLLDHKIDDLHILNFDISLSELEERIVNRLTCSSCGEIYNIKSKPPIDVNGTFFCKCSPMIQTLTKRLDDNVDSLKTRYLVFNETTIPVIQKYKQYPNFHKINANQSLSKIEEIVIDILKL